ncbi:DUF4190 domain-containing protein [Leucobacter chromiireducens]|uniref:DUF4190 domain-containing protein n=1 Tax=Leucobacter chromiireducens TaxID=283877 RepID=UPI000F63EA69|nr:DUF4190 domain-containing protein [Leucobacter chromiireducens]
MSDPTTPGAENPQPTTPNGAQAPEAQLPAAPEQQPIAPQEPIAAQEPIAPPAYVQAPAYPAAPPEPAAGSGAPGAPVAPGAMPAGAAYPGQQQPPMNALAIVALVTGILVNVVGIICGHIALSQIKRTGERGRGMALAGTIIGYVSLAFSIIGVIFFFVFAGFAVQAANTAATESLSQYEDATAELQESLEGESSELGAAPADAERSAEFCAALNEAIDMTDPNTAEYSADEAALYAKLGELDNPNKELYAKFAELIADPAKLATDSDAATLAEEAVTAMTEDYLACM